jgi:DNA polymerase III psi subunit
MTPDHQWNLCCPGCGRGEIAIAANSEVFLVARAN